MNTQQLIDKMEVENYKNIQFSMYNNFCDVNPSTLSCGWPEFVAVMQERQFPITEDKSHFKHFSMSIFEHYKNDDHGINMFGLVLDFDTKSFVEAELLRFIRYEFVLYTSYNHQRVKDGTDYKCDKFRLIIPFDAPCSFQRWKEINKHVLTLAPTVDPCSQKFTQCYTLPCTHPNNQHNMRMIHNNVGDFLKCDEWPNNPTVTAPTVSHHYSSDDVDKDEILSLLKKSKIDSYEQWWQMVQAMKQVGYSQQDLISISSNNINHSSSSLPNKTSEICTRYWNRQIIQQSSEQGIGKLITLIRNGGFPEYKKQQSIIKRARTVLEKRLAEIQQLKEK